MSIEKEVKDLDNEVQELHTYVSIDEQEKLNRIATIFLPIAALLSLFALFSDKEYYFNGQPNSWHTVIVLSIMVLVVILMFFGLSKTKLYDWFIHFINRKKS